MFRRVSDAFIRALGHPTAFAVAVALVLIWGASGPLFAWSNTWQLIINTSTTIATFLMLFLVQNAQNRDTVAIQAKLDRLIRDLSEVDEDRLPEEAQPD